MLLLRRRLEVRELFSVSNGVFFRFHSHPYSTVSSSNESASIPKTHLNLMTDYLINSLGFTEKEAISVSSKVSHLKSTENARIVVNAFKDYGLDDTQIRNVVYSAPKVLTASADKNLEPKIRFFQELGLSGPDLVKFIKKGTYFLKQGLHTQLIPMIDYLRKLLGSDEKVIKAISKSQWMILRKNLMRRLSANVELLQNYGLSDEKISKIFVSNPQSLVMTPEWVEGKLQSVEVILGIPPTSNKFFYGLLVISQLSESSIEEKIQVFRSFGWSDSEISMLLKSQPLCLTCSEASIHDRLSFFMKELGYTPSYLIGCTSFWTLSLEKRMKPRNDVLNILKENKLVKDKLALYSFVTYSELKFLGLLQSFESHIPGLREYYMNSVKSKAE